MAETRVRLGTQERTTLVVFGDEGSLPLLGAYTLEAFALGVDPLGRRPVPLGDLPMPGNLPVSGRGIAGTLKQVVGLEDRTRTGGVAAGG